MYILSTNCLSVQSVCLQRSADLILPLDEVMWHNVVVLGEELSQLGQEESREDSDMTACPELTAKISHLENLKAVSGAMSKALATSREFGVQDSLVGSVS